MHLNSIGRKHGGRLFGKQIRLNAAVVSNGGRRFFRMLFKVIGKTLRRPADSVDIHPICPCADNAAQAAGAKSEIPVKTVVNFIGFVFDAEEFFF